MGSFIVKVSPQEDLYLKFSDGEEVVTAAGTYKDLLSSKKAGKWQLGRADRFGTSALTHSTGEWDSSGIRVASLMRDDADYYWLQREKFKQYGELIQSGNLEEADGMLTPLE